MCIDIYVVICEEHLKNILYVSVNGVLIMCKMILYADCFLHVQRNYEMMKTYQSKYSKRTPYEFSIHAYIKSTSGIKTNQQKC